MTQELVYTPQVQKYLDIIAEYEREFKKWEARVDKITKRYRDDNKTYTSDNETTRFNILWSNVQTLMPAAFSRVPKPDVSRRFKDNDPVGRVASLILERALEFELQHYSDFKSTMKYCVFDRFIGGRATAWVRYEPHISVQTGTLDLDQDGVSDTAGLPEDGLQVASAGTETEFEPAEQIDYECAPIDYVHWRDFGHNVARTWEEVGQVWRRVYMGREALAERFGEQIASRIPLDSKPPQNGMTYKSSLGPAGNKAIVYELWDKEKGIAVWLCKSYAEVLDVKPDPLGLEEFFPCPRPLYATITTETLVPVPDFAQYQDQANELDTISDRIDGLIKALKVRGVHNAAIKELQRLFTEAGNNDLIPVKDWSAFAEKNGLKGAIDIVDLTPIVAALEAAYRARAEVMDQIYGLLGLADIIRGESDAAETATAQAIKAQYGSLRMRYTKDDVAEYATSLMKIKSQIMCSKFQDATLTSIAGVDQLLPEDRALVPQALQMLRSKVVRNFRIEVNSDSMVILNEEAEKASRVEFLDATSKFLAQAIPAAQATPELAPMLVQMLKFGITAFKAGKTLEGMFDTALDQLQQQAQASAGQPKPNPEMMKVQGQMALEQSKQHHDQQMAIANQQFEQQKHQWSLELEQFKAQKNAEVEMARQHFQAQEEQQRNILEAQRAELDSRNEAALRQMEASSKAALEEVKGQFQLLLAAINNQAKIEVAEIAAGATLEAADISAAKAAQPEGQ